jgi:hypothetical protein
MTIDRIKYEETFPTAIQYKNIRLTAEATIDSGHEDVLECYNSLKRSVNDAFLLINPYTPAPSTDFNTGIEERPLQKATTKEEWEDAMIKEIGEVTKVDEINGVKAQIGLLAYSTAASQSERVKAAYDQRLKQIS